MHVHMEDVPEDFRQFAREQFAAERLRMDALVAQLAAHKDRHECLEAVCCGPLFNGSLEGMGDNELRGALHYAIWYITQLRTLPGA